MIVQSAAGNLQGTKTQFPWAKSIVILTYYYGKYSYPKELQGKYAKAFFLEADGNGSQSFDLKRFESWLSDHKIHAARNATYVKKLAKQRHFNPLLIL